MLALGMLALAVQAGAAVVLLFAGAGKLAQPAGIRQTIGALGLPGRPAALAAALAVVELAAAAALVVAPGSLVTAAAVLGLGLVFALAGAAAMARPVRVHCACLGPALSGELGVRQLLSLPLWVAVAASGVAVRPEPFLDVRPELLVALIVAVTLAVLVRMVPLAREHRTLLGLMDGG